MSVQEGESCSRPALGPLFLTAAGGWVSVAVVEEVSWDIYVGSLPSAWVSVAAALIVAIGLLLLFVIRMGRRSSPRLRASPMVFPLLVFIVAFISTGICSAIYWHAWYEDANGLSQRLTTVSEPRLELTGDPVAGDYGVISPAELLGFEHPIKVRLVWPDDAQPLSAGHVIVATGHLGSPDAAEGGRWQHRNGYVGTLTLARFDVDGVGPDLRGMVCDFRDRAFAMIGGMGDVPAAGLLAGTLIGRQDLYAGTEVEQDFRTTGLAHLMAVSGSHMVVVVALLGWLFARIPLRRRMRAVLLIVFLMFYVALTGFAPSALRACTMSAMGYAGGVLGRRRSALNALCLCVLVFLAIAPDAAFSLGFQLSVAAVFGLVMFSSLGTRWLSWLLPARLHALSEPVSVTLVAAAVTLPLTIPLFAQLPLVSPLANLIIGPLMALVIGVGIPAILIGTWLSGLGNLLLMLAETVGAFMVQLVHILADIPGACVPLLVQAPVLIAISSLALAGIYVAWPLPGRLEGLRPRLGVACFCAVPLLFILVWGLGGLAGLFNIGSCIIESEAEVVMLDVGQGDSMLVRDGDAAVLIDTGQQGQVLETDLASHGVTHLDAVILTHKDADHAGALSSLAGVVTVDHVYIHADLLDFDEEASVLESASWVTRGRGAEGLRPGARIKVGRFTLTLLAPENGGSSENDDSLIQVLEYDDDADGDAETRGLLTGDAEQDALAGVYSRVGAIDFLKVAHHGSRGGLSSEELMALRPRFALISVGVDNGYGHPAAETLEALRGSGAQVFRTDQNGEITMDFESSSLSVRGQR